MFTYPDTQPEKHSFLQAWRSLAESRFLPLALLAVGSASNVVYAHTPLVAFAAMSGVILPRRRAILVVLLIWLVNQGVGFGLRDYPLTAVAFRWGLGRCSWPPLPAGGHDLVN